MNCLINFRSLRTTTYLSSLILHTLSKSIFKKITHVLLKVTIHAVGQWCTIRRSSSICQNNISCLTSDTMSNPMHRKAGPRFRQEIMMNSSTSAARLWPEYLETKTTENFPACTVKKWRLHKLQPVLRMIAILQPWLKLEVLPSDTARWCLLRLELKILDYQRSSHKLECEPYMMYLKLKEFHLLRRSMKIQL